MKSRTGLCFLAALTIVLHIVQIAWHQSTLETDNAGFSMPPPLLESTTLGMSPSPTPQALSSGRRQIPASRLLISIGPPDTVGAPAPQGLNCDGHATAALHNTAWQLHDTAEQQEQVAIRFNARVPGLDLDRAPEPVGPWRTVE